MGDGTVRSTQLRAPGDTLGAFQARMNAMPARRSELIREARAAGHSWRAIGAALGMSHVAAMKAARHG